MPGSAQSITITSGCSCLRQSHGFLAVTGFALDDDVFLVLQHAAESAAHQCVIVNQQH